MWLTGRAGATVMAPSGDANPARASNHPATSVSASGTATAKRPAAPSTAKPSRRLAPEPPNCSGTQASGSPASESARHNGPLQAPSFARLMVWGSAKSAKIRAAISATIWSLSRTIATFVVPGPRFGSRPFTLGHGGAKRQPWQGYLVVGLRRAEDACLRLIGKNTPASVTAKQLQHRQQRPSGAASREDF